MKPFLTFSALVSSCRILCYDNQLRINDTTIRFEYDLKDIAVSKDKVFVLYAKLDGGTFEELPRNSIMAYDFSGNYLWNIGDFTPGETWPFVSIYIHNEHSIKKEPLTDSLSIKEAHEYLLCQTYGDLRFIIDVTDSKAVQKISGRFNA